MGNTDKTIAVSKSELIEPVRLRKEITWHVRYVVQKQNTGNGYVMIARPNETVNHLKNILRKTFAKSVDTISLTIKATRKTVAVSPVLALNFDRYWAE